MGDISNIFGQTEVNPFITLVDDSLTQVSDRISDVLKDLLKTGWGFGNGANQLNKAYVARAVFDQATVQTYNIQDGSLLNVFGGAFNPDKMKYLIISHAKESLASQVSITGTFMSAILMTPVLTKGAALIIQRPEDGWPIGLNETIISTNDDAGNDATVDYVFLASL